MQNYRSKFKNLIYFGFLVVIFNFSFLIFNLDKAEASALSLDIDPPITIIKAIPPASLTSSINIQNKGDAPITLQIQLKPFKAKGENARPPASSLVGEVGRGELEYLTSGDFSWLKNIQILDGNTPVENIVLNPKQQKQLTLSITVPQDTSVSARPPATSSNQSQINQAGVAGEAGPARQSNAQALAGGPDYYFSVVFVSTDLTTVKSNSSVNQVGIATNVLLSIGPAELPKASVEEFSTNLFFEKGPVSFKIRVENAGTHFIKPAGEIIIKNVFGQNVRRLNLANVNVLSNSIRAIPTASWKENFPLGLYIATLNISMSDEGPVFTKTIYFLAFPLQILITIAAIAVIVIAIGNRLRLYMNKDRIWV